MIGAMLWFLTLLLQAPLVVLDPSVTASDVSALKVQAVRAEAPPDDELEAQQLLVRQAQEATQRGRQAALELRTDQAIHLFEEAHTLYGRAIAAIGDYAGMAQSLLDLGATCLDAGKTEKANAAFRRALAIGSGVRPDPNHYTPAVVSRFAAMEKELQRAARGSITIHSRPEGAEVYFDGRRIGHTPVSLNDVLLGEHLLVVRAPDHHRFSTRVTLTKDKLEHTEVYLRELPPPPTPVGRAAWAARRHKSDALVVAQKELNASPLVVVVQRGAMLEAHVPGQPLLTAKTLAELNEQLGQFNVPTPESREGQPVAVKDAPASRPGTHWAVAMLPAGIGQMTEKRYGWGTFFLVSETLLLAANLTAFFLVQADRNALDRTTFDNPARSEVLKWTANIALGLLIVDVIAGGIDGVLHRNDTAVSAR